RVRDSDPRPLVGEGGGGRHADSCNRVPRDAIIRSAPRRNGERLRGAMDFPEWLRTGNRAMAVCARRCRAFRANPTQDAISGGSAAVMGSIVLRTEISRAYGWLRGFVSFRDSTVFCLISPDSVTLSCRCHLILAAGCQV